MLLLGQSPFSTTIIACLPFFPLSCLVQTLFVRFITFLNDQFGLYFCEFVSYLIARGKPKQNSYFLVTCLVTNSFLGCSRYRERNIPNSSHPSHTSKFQAAFFYLSSETRPLKPACHSETIAFADENVIIKPTRAVPYTKRAWRVLNLPRGYYKWKPFSDKC